MIRFWNRKTLSLEGRIVIFKMLAISKMVYFAVLTVIPNSLIEELQKKFKKPLYGTPHIQKVVIKHYVTTLKMVG